MKGSKEKKRGKPAKKDRRRCVRHGRSKQSTRSAFRLSLGATEERDDSKGATDSLKLLEKGCPAKKKAKFPRKFSKT